MFEVESLELQNVVYFKDAKLDVKRHPFTVISGHNADSRISDQTSNGAGKSLLWSSFPNARYDSTPLATGKNRKTMLGEKNAKIAFQFKHPDGNTYKVTQTASKFIIERNGVNMEVRTVPLQKQEIERIFPITEDEFYSYTYLQSQRPLSFQIDKPAARLQYITSIFRLDVYDQLKKYFTKKLGEIKNKQVEFDVITNQLLKTNGLLERLKWDAKSEKKLKRAKAFIAEVSDDLKKRQVKLERLRSALAACEEYSNLKARRKKLKPKLDRKAAEQAMEAIELLNEYKSNKRSYDERMADIEEAIAELGKVGNKKKLQRSLKVVVEELEKLGDKLEAMQNDRRAFKEASERYDEVRSDLKEMGVSAKTPVLKSKQIEALEQELYAHRAVIKLGSIVDECADGTCPTCTQKVDVKSFAKKIKVSDRRSKEIKLQLRANELLIELAALKPKLEFNEDAYGVMRNLYKEKADQEEQLELSIEACDKLEKLLERKAKLKKPKKPDVSVEYTASELSTIIEQHTEIRRLDTAIAKLEEKYPDLDEASIKAALKKAKASSRELEEKYAEAQHITSVYGAKAGEYKMLMRERSDAEASLEGLKPIIAQRDMFKALEKAYSAKGLKVNAANEILAQIEQNMNRYSNLIFAEPFKFSLFAQPDGVHCRVDRGKGKESDVRELSGAESDCFRLLWMWVMLIMAEPERRTNFVVLDEPDAHMDVTTKSLFIDRYLPALRSLVPHVFLITPLDKHVYSECAYLTVVKQNGVSKLVESSNDCGGLRLAYTGPDSGETKPRKKAKKK